MIVNNLITTCTRCKKPLKEFKYFVSLTMLPKKEKESGAWESIENLNVTTNEVLCDECFEKFSSLLEEMNNV